jgi:hypothetical protein
MTMTHADALEAYGRADRARKAAYHSMLAAKRFLRLARDEYRRLDVARNAAAALAVDLDTTNPATSEEQPS